MISFIIPIFNCKKYLYECFVSILSFNVDKEIIFVDDGSTDGSEIICFELASKYDSIKYYRKENGGAASARNLGIDRCSGDYIVFVDSDDYLDGNWWKHIDNCLSSESELIIYGMSFDYYQGDKIERNEILSNKYDGIKNKEEIISSFNEFFVNNTLSSACNKVFRSDIIKKNDIHFNESMTLYEDMDFVIQYLCHINNVFFIPDALYHYRLDNNQSHYKNRINYLNKVKSNLDCLSESLIALSDSCDVNYVRSNLYGDVLMSSLMLNDYSIDYLRNNLNGYFNNVDSKYLNEGNKKIWNMIMNEEYSKLYLFIRNRKLKSRIKRMVKRIIGR